MTPVPLLRIVGTWLAALCAAMLLISPAAAQDARQRLALVIGNAAYAGLPPLPTATADARLVRNALLAVGFAVDTAENTSKADLEKAVASFAGKVEDGATVVVYYAGYGLQLDNENYAVPVDARLADAADLPKVAMPVKAVLDAVEGGGAATVILILDAGHAGALGGVANAERIGDGLARIAAPNPGTLIAYSSAPGSAVKATGGEAGAYAEALAAAMIAPGQSLETMFKQTRARVVVATAGEQVPWESSSLFQEIVLVPQPDAPAIEQADACDLAAAHPSDPERVGPSVEYASLDPQRAIPACEKAVAAHPDNMRFKTLLARALDKAGRGEEAFKLNQVAMDAGYIGGYHNMGNLYRKGLGVEKDLARAFELYLHAAERGHPEDQSNVGFMYMKGEGVDVDYAQSMIWLTRAAQQNWATAYDKLGLLHLNGWGVPKDAAQACAEFGKGANLGNAPAMVNFANCYRSGDGVAQDFGKARDLFMQAALLGNAPAYVNLGHLSAKGQGTALDPVEAAFWFTLAVGQGSEEAQKQLQKLQGDLSDSDRETLKQRLDEWSRGRFG